ncbi:interleukin-17 receptor D [Brachionichthys hirsutus]|uniref:interleukin-17 receptor D n=1 Tax=Brachionichthys hirsutus TaxID=412623 RepID=UPI0036046FE8
MLKAVFVCCHLLALCELHWAHSAVSAITPTDCSLDCLQQGRPGCEYCRITREHVQEARLLGQFAAEGDAGGMRISTSRSVAMVLDQEKVFPLQDGWESLPQVKEFKRLGVLFSSCIPWPCFDLLGKEDPKICQHYVQAPKDVRIEFVQEPDPETDTIVVSWKPSYYGIAFLRGFQVILQALGGSKVACQLFLFHRNLSLPVSHTERVYMSDPFPGLSLDSRYAVTVMALPVPEQWEHFYHSEIFSTRSCSEKNGLEQCKKDWYPRYVGIKREGTAATVTFNLAPASLGIISYFSLCYANGMKMYTDIKPDFTQNGTHHSFQMNDLQGDTNYTCQIAANEVDAVRKIFHVYVLPVQKEGATPRSVSPSLALILPLCLTVVVIIVVLLTALTRKRPQLHMRKFKMNPYLSLPVLTSYEQQLPKESRTLEEVVSLPRDRPLPPRLLICYSCRDGPAHVRAVMLLGVFIQQHMATQVILDLWETLNMAVEGGLAWYRRHIQESDFILVICSQGLSDNPEPPESEGDNVEEELNVESSAFSSDSAVQLIREEVGRAKASGQDLSKYMAAVFEYSEEQDIPTELRLVSQYRLATALEPLFSHLHGVALHRPGSYLKIKDISEEGFTKLPAGAALQQAICEAGMAMRAKNQRTMEGED